MSTMTTSLGSRVDHQRVWDLGYELLELANSDEYCDVWRIRHRSTYEEFAWKQLRPEWEHDPRAIHRLENEAAVGQLVPSALLLKLVAEQLAESPRYVIWEWPAGRTLEQLLNDSARLSIASALWIARQCAEALHVLLDAGLTHGALKSNAVLIDTRSGSVRLTNLGSSQRVSHGSSLEVGRRNRQSGPLADYETVASSAHRQGTGKDLYDVGVILYQSLTGRMPFAADTPAELVRGRHSNVSEDVRRLRPEASQEIAELVSMLLTVQPAYRITHPTELINRLIPLEVDELTKLV